MPDYRPPIADMLFLLQDVLGFKHEDLDPQTCEAILEEASKLASDVLAPLNYEGDKNGARLENGQVFTAKGFKDAYKAYCEGGWNAVPFDPEYGGQGMPYALAFPIQEMWQGANMSFGLCPLLNQGAVEAIISHGTPEQKGKYLPRLISGEWTGTMNLTESGAGSDLGLIRTKAQPQSDGTYKISGQKIFITYGDHDMADNIIHLVLARSIDSPPDVKGISLFIVPKILEDGNKNSLSCIGLEHKLGIHASPTCTMEFDGAIGYLVGELNMGLKYMFTMMNNARLSVGLQGVAIAERAYQHALSYANERVQGKSFSSGERIAIAGHPDVKRMLLTMHSMIMAGRALTYSAALALDTKDQNLIGLLTPIVKSWCTDMAVEVASLGVQVHGGMGFIEETGAAQFYRDARILPIYEGTNGIQAADLVFRKVGLDNGAYALSYIRSMDGLVNQHYLDELTLATQKIASLLAQESLDDAAWLATPYLKAFGTIAGAAMMARIEDTSMKKEMQEMVDFYRANVLPQALGFLNIVSH